MNIQGWIPLGLTGLISLQSRGLLKSLAQHHSSKASILRRSAFFMVQLSHPYITTGKTTALTRWTLASKGMSLLFNMLSRFVIAFLPRSKRLLISWLEGYILDLYSLTSWQTLSFAAMCLLVTDCRRVLWNVTILEMRNLFTFHSAISITKTYVRTVFMELLLEVMFYILSPSWK